MNVTDKPIYAWHFSDGYLRFDMRSVEVAAGLVLEADGEPIVAKKGFHACRGAHDALFNLSSNPPKTLIISRVKLSGKMVTADLGYEVIAAQRREHLWVADADKAVEEFALSYIEQVLRLFERAKVVFGDTLDWAIKNRRLLYQQELPQDKLDELAEYVKFAKPEPIYWFSPSYQIPTRRFHKDWEKPEFWLDVWSPVSLDGYSSSLHDKLAQVIRYKTLFLASDGVPHFANLVQSLIEGAATIAFRKAERDAILKHISENMGSIRLPQIPPTPEKYIEQMRLRYGMASLNAHLHNVLMQLAPAGYVEPKF
jgi:hypothetical protein